MERGAMNPSSQKQTGGKVEGGVTKRLPVNHPFSANELRPRGLQGQQEKLAGGNSGWTFPELFLNLS